MSHLRSLHRRAPTALAAVATVFALAASACGTAESRDAPEDADAAETETAPAPPTLDAGTELAFRVNETVSTDSHGVGDLFTADVAMDVTARDGTVVLAAGTPARWEITRAGETEDGRTVLAFRLASLQVGGDWQPVDATVVSADLAVDEKDSDTETAAKVAIGTAAGALVGQILGKDTESTVKGAVAGTAVGTAVALSTRGGNARMDEGSIITIRLEEPLSAR